MRICVLEHPRIHSEKRFNDIANTPLWSCLMGGYAASSLKNAGYDVVYWDTTRTGWDFEKTEEEILKLDPDLLAVNTVYIWEHTEMLFDFFSQLKDKKISGHLNLFGFFPTLSYRDILQHAEVVDSIAVGEYEHTLIALAKALEAGMTIAEIRGLARRVHAPGDMYQPRLPEKNPDHFPYPVRYTNPGDTVSILASRGCYNHCRFCPIPSFYNQGPLWRGRTPEDVFEEIKMLAGQGYTDFYFADPNFIGPGRKGKERILRLMALIKPLNITFGMETRPEDIDEEIMEKLVDAGFRSLLLGIESGSPHVLERLDKKTPLSESEHAIHLLRRFGIEPEIGFLMFVPDSTMADLRHNFDFLVRNNLLSPLSRTANLLSHRQIVLKGTSGYSRFHQQGRLLPSGFLGTEGDVSYLDDSVYVVSEIIIHTCHRVLKEMQKPDSPIYWEKEQTSIMHQAVNDYLVNLFKSLIMNDQPSIFNTSVDEHISNNEMQLTALFSDIGNEVFSLN